MSMSFRKMGLIAVALFALAAIALYGYIVSGGLIARQSPPAIEKNVTRWMLNVSVPDSAKTRKNPLLTDSGSLDVFAGQDLYKQKCEVCHGYDGSGKTDASAGLYPQPLDLQGPEVKRATDGELFYFIRCGIRNTAMPGWQLPDQDTWRLVVFIRNLPKVASVAARAPTATASPVSATYVGSAACKSPRVSGKRYLRGQSPRSGRRILVSRALWCGFHRLCRHGLFEAVDRDSYNGNYLARRKPLSL